MSLNSEKKLLDGVNYLFLYLIHLLQLFPWSVCPYKTAAGIVSAFTCRLVCLSRTDSPTEVVPISIPMTFIYSPSSVYLL